MEFLSFVLSDRQKENKINKMSLEHLVSVNKEWPDMPIRNKYLTHYSYVHQHNMTGFTDYN